jgi:ribosomal silencing factor RsfS
MKKLILLLLIILTSCASRHVKVDRIDIKKDSVAETKVVVTTVENEIKTDSTNIATTIDNSEITITPIDTCKEIIVEGKVYKNVVLKIKKNKANTLYTNNKTESNNKRTDSVATTKVNKTENTSGKNKTIDKKANYCWILWLLLLILILYLLWRNKRRLLLGL